MLNSGLGIGAATGKGTLLHAPSCGMWYGPMAVAMRFCSV
jgi:lipid-binding SYLF domain-containing protein